MYKFTRPLAKGERDWVRQGVLGYLTRRLDGRVFGPADVKLEKGIDEVILLREGNKVSSLVLVMRII